MQDFSQHVGGYYCLLTGILGVAPGFLVRLIAMLTSRISVAGPDLPKRHVLAVGRVVGCG